jgi:hypothetical protein
MTNRPKRFDPKSRWVKYRDGLWIQSRKRLYLYWFKFLQHAERSPDHRVDWSKYGGWGGANVVLGSKFDEWWEERWKDLFGVKREGDEPKFPLVTTRPKADGIRSALLVYENRHRGSNLEIADWVQKEEFRRRYGVPSFSDEIDVQTKQSRVGRYKRAANRYLSGICEGKFPVSKK